MVDSDYTWDGVSKTLKYFFEERKKSPTTYVEPHM